ncbi:MAG: AAA family ATPase [Ginsengibacter sp.]
MSETLTIKNFGPIKNVELEFRKVNILIGDQGTGKSSVGKVLSVVKNVLDRSDMQLWINGEAAGKERMNEYFNDEFKKNLDEYGITNYLKSDTYVEFKDSVFHLIYENNEVDLQKIPDGNRDRNTRIIAYIPAFREAVMLLNKSIFGLARLKAPLPQYFFSFGQYVSNAKNLKSFYDYSNILDIRYKNVNENDIVILKNGKEINIGEASSAVNSVVPLLLVFDNAVESNYSTDRRVYNYLNCPYIIIEEPELNCFPTTQKKLMEYFISKIKYETSADFDYYCRLVITTHSPYILTSLNNMMYAYQVGEKYQLQANEIINKKYWINPDDVSAYMLQDGICEDIFDREENLIKAEKIDGVSGFLNEQFDALLNIELVPK